MSDTISFVTHASGASSVNKRPTYEQILAKQRGTVYEIPPKYQRFNEDVETKSTQEQMQRTHSLMSATNLAAFTKQRPFLKVIGTPNLNATASSKCSQKSSVFSQRSRPKSRQDQPDARSYHSAQSHANSRLNRSLAAEQHKRHILDVVNKLNEEELEKVSEMLKASEAGLPNQQSEVDAASKAAGEGDIVEDGGVGEQDADNAEA